MSNLLTQKKLSWRRKEYAYRLAISFFGLCAGIGLVGSMVLLPTFIIVRAERASTDIELEALAQSATAREEKASRDELIEARKRIESVDEMHNKSGKAVTVLETAISERPAGVTITNAQYTLKEDVYTLRISGLLKNRSQLQTYVAALKGARVFTDVAVPVSALIDETQFVITATGNIEL